MAIEKPLQQEREITAEEALRLELFRLNLRESVQKLTVSERMQRMRIMKALERLVREKNYKEVYNG